MERIPVENKTAMARYVAGCMIPPGETRHFDKSQVPREYWPVAAQETKAEAPDDPLAELLKGNVPSVVAALPGLSDDDLDRLGELEQKGAARKGVLNAIGEALLTRADRGNADIIGGLHTLDGDALAALAETEKAKGDQADAELLAAIEAEAAKRAQG